jgi:hypothetical protein
MELEFWTELSAAISAVQGKIKRRRRDKHSTALIVRVHLWAALHDRPICWACDSRSWTPKTRPEDLPDQSTMSRRLRRNDFEPFLQAMYQRLNGAPRDRLVRIIDGKPLELSNHSGDPDARWGRGVSRMSLGYKLHMIYSGNPLPDAFAITPLDVCEKQMAARMIKRVKGQGYLLGDSHYDANWLYDLCEQYGHLLIAERAKPGTGIGHRPQADQRLRAIELLEPPLGINAFGPTLYRQRTGIERGFSNLCCFGGGLAMLPFWVRRIWRVRAWVWAKLLINAARIRINSTYVA